MAKALILGGNGFIGSHLVDALASAGWETLVLDLNQRRYDFLPTGVRFMQGSFNQTHLLREALTGVDVVFHLAWASVHESSNRNMVADVEANLIPSLQLLKSCVEADVRRIIFVSSGGTVYGPAQQRPIPENHPKNPINAYGIHKLTVEKYLNMFYHLHGLEYIILRPSVPYGPRQNPLGKQGAVVVFLYRIWRNLPLTLWGDGHITRDFFYISDLILALLACTHCSMNSNPVFNIGGCEELSLLQLIEHIEQLVGQRAQLDFQPSRNFDAQHIILDTHRAKQALDWTPQIPFSR
ncbi:MAG TPA: NAD-dependent epimerase/dehydratase family protein, partial [Anaerolineae bacterium]